jgi:hypothetical protein
MKASSIVAITAADAQAIRIIHGVPLNRMHVVRNGINESFFTACPEAWQSKFGPKGFVLCVGAIQQRKNQLRLLEVCNRLGLAVVLLGPVLPGEGEYGKLVAQASKENEKLGGHWLKDLRNEDELLVSAYAACKLFVLLSSAETQPLSVMQAMAAKKPVLLLRSSYVFDPLFRDLPVADSLEEASLTSTLKNCWEGGKLTELSADFTWTQVASRLQDIYKSIL